MSIKEELMALEDDYGFINPYHVINWANVNRGSEIASRLEWNDEIAAEAYRLEQVRFLIRVYVRDENNERITISLIQDRHQNGGYRRIESVMSNAQMREAALNEALEELNRVEQRYSHLQELSRVFTEVRTVRARRQRIALSGTTQPTA